MKYVAWYQKFDEENGSKYRGFESQGMPSKMEVRRSYFPMRELEADDLEGVFFAMQGEQWSPNGEARELVRESGTAHTSMMVADVIEEIGTGRMYFVASAGFAEIEA